MGGKEKKERGKGKGFGNHFYKEKGRESYKEGKKKVEVEEEVTKEDFISKGRGFGGGVPKTSGKHSKMISKR